MSASPLRLRPASQSASMAAPMILPVQMGLFDDPAPASASRLATAPAAPFTTDPLPAPATASSKAPAATPAASLPPVCAGEPTSLAAAGEPAPAPRAEHTPGKARPSRPEPPRPPGARELTLGGQPVVYALRRARRRSIGFTIGPDGLAVSAPRWVGVAEIESALQAKAGWILRKLQESRERRARVEATAIEWRDGGLVPFLGENLILVLDPRATGAELRGAEAVGLAARAVAGVSVAPFGLPGATAAVPGVRRLTLHLGLPQSAQPAQIRDTVQSWLQRQARRIFEERCALYAERLGVRMRRLALSSASTRWGSASADGSIRLNWRLVHFGLPVIDYVVAHELAHLREMNHSPAFWAVVRQALPGFEEVRGALRKQVLPAFD
jgi:predicted metal-dependent hydrolase